jgi:hypothetical protein
MKNALVPTLAVCALLAACGGGDAPEAEMTDGGAMMSDEPIGTVTIVEPANNSTVSGSTVSVQLEVAGFPIVEAGNMTPGTGHHHLYLDADVASTDEPVPTVPGTIVHMGDASSSFTFENVSPGEHRLIAVVADGAHVPLRPLVVDTVVFTVQ